MDTNKKILIVDDQISFLETIVETFEHHKQNYEILRTTNSETAIEIAKDELPDLIITDWEMPILSGIEMIKKLKSLNKTADIPIIMCTGVMTGPENLKIALEAGAIDYINKPIDETELIARTQSTLKIAECQKQMLEQKNRELAENSMYLVQNNEFLNKMTEKIQFVSQNLDDKDKVQESINDLLESIETKIKEYSWNRFDIYFQRVHQGFQKNLTAKFPTLSAAELKLCTLLRLGMNSKDIASVVFQTVESIKVGRSRLRKKFNLDKDTNLVTFLSSF